MFDFYRNRPSFLSVHRYATQEQLLVDLEDKVIRPAELPPPERVGRYTLSPCLGFTPQIAAPSGPHLATVTIVARPARSFDRDGDVLLPWHLARTHTSVGPSLVQCACLAHWSSV
jgi:hypothetical protein